MKDLELRKTMTKKAYFALVSKRRGTNGFNTGTRTFKDARDLKYDRKLWKRQKKGSCVGDTQLLFLPKYIA